MENKRSERRKPELLAPAGDMEKLQMAVWYGADAVYLGAPDFSLRAQASGFAGEELAAAVALAHAAGVKLYLAVNVYAHEQHLPALRRLLPEVAALGVDALIIADPGVFKLAGSLAPGVARHISTQAASSNSECVRFWQQQGASRVVLAREVSLAECGQIAAAAPIELEIFVHGAVCMAYSGRCLLSSFLCGRSANLGDCAQPCRWQYKMTYRLEEAKRPGQFMPIEEDRWGSYIFNSKDLRLLELLPEILLSGAASLKIEGRMKSAYYVANVTRVYRQALDACWELWRGLDFAPDLAALRALWEPALAAADWGAELDKLSQRQYFTGFALAEGLAAAPGAPDQDAYVYDNSYSQRVYDFAGVVLGYDSATRRLHIEQRNHLALGDEVEIIQPAGPVRTLRLTAIWGEDGEELAVLPHAKQHAWLACPFAMPVGSILRRAVRNTSKEAADERQ